MPATVASCLCYPYLCTTLFQSNPRLTQLPEKPQDFSSCLAMTTMVVLCYFLLAGKGRFLPKSDW